MPIKSLVPLKYFNKTRQNIEKERRRQIGQFINWFIIALSLFIGLFVLSLLFSAPHFDLNPVIVIVALIVVLALPIAGVYLRNENYKTSYVFLVLSKAVLYFRQDKKSDIRIDYNAAIGISRSDFSECGVFGNRRIDEYKTSDLVTGRIEKTNFQCAQINASEIRIVATKNGTRKEKIRIFRGMFFVADFHKNFQGTTFVVPDYVEGTLGNFGHSLQKTFARKGYGGLEMARMENPKFERDFAVYTSDQIEARYILTPMMLERIVELRRLCNDDLHIAFRYGKMYVAWDTAGHWLNPPNLWQKVTSDICFKETYRRLSLMLGLIDHFELNTRIWGKL